MARKSPSTFLLVDGNNVIHAWPDLLELHQRRRGLAHTELCHRLRQVHDAGTYRVVVVFDGRRSQLNEERETGGFQIIYSDAGRTADDIIERLALSYAKKHRIVVATDDGAEADMVSSFGAEVMSAGALRDLVDASEGDWRRYLK